MEKEPQKEWDKYFETADSVLRPFLETMFTEEYREGFYLSEILPAKDAKWLLHFKRKP